MLPSNPPSDWTKIYLNLGGCGDTCCCFWVKFICDSKSKNHIKLYETSYYCGIDKEEMVALYEEVKLACDFYNIKYNEPIDFWDLDELSVERLPNQEKVAKIEVNDESKILRN